MDHHIKFLPNFSVAENLQKFDALPCENCEKFIRVREKFAQASFKNSYAMSKISGGWNQ